MALNDEYTNDSDLQFAENKNTTTPPSNVAEEPDINLGTPEPATEPEINVGAEYGDTAEDNVDATAEDTENGEESKKSHTKREIRGAAVGAGVVGLLVGGPIVGAIAAGGAALAVTSDGKIGKHSRAGGEKVAKLGDGIKNFDKKHEISSKTKKGFTKGANWVSNKLKPKKGSQDS
eukprot:Nitzschia sp. Nitz4//scaffold7_size249615//225705//226232//NITZ4_001213-RA/size249615-processed-gene-0.163-mRNA-1//1//CDS//3329558550//2332//frame0